MNAFAVNGRTVFIPGCNRSFPLSGLSDMVLLEGLVYRVTEFHKDSMTVEVKVED